MPTNQIADGDAQPEQGDHPSAARDRQCGRCRRVFPGDPAGEATAIEDWWLCGLCRESLLGAAVSRPEG